MYGGKLCPPNLRIANEQCQAGGQPGDRRANMDEQQEAVVQQVMMDQQEVMHLKRRRALYDGSFNSSASPGEILWSISMATHCSALHTAALRNLNTRISQYALRRLRNRLGAMGEFSDRVRHSPESSLDADSR